jgi:hypothetical protein
MRAQFEIGAMIDDGQRRRDDLAVARGTAGVGVEIDRALLDRARRDGLDQGVLPVRDDLVEVLAGLLGPQINRDGLREVRTSCGPSR